MSYGFEYNTGGYGGGFDPMGNSDIFATGGGFINDGNNSISPDKKSKDKNSIIPLSVKQFLESVTDNGTFSVDGKELHVVKVIGYVEFLEEHSTNVVYKIHDGTGRVDCKLWVVKDKGLTTAQSQIGLNSYVKIFGNPREYEGKRELLIYDISVITDWNEVSHHLLDSVISFLQRTKGPLQKSGVVGLAGVGGLGGPGMQASPGKVTSNYSAPSVPRQQYTPNVQMGGMTLHSSHQPMQGGTLKNELLQQVIDAFKQGRHSEQGLNARQVLDILSRRGISATINQLNAMISHLAEEGNLYNTFEDYFKLTYEE